MKTTFDQILKTNLTLGSFPVSSKIFSLGREAEIIANLAQEKINEDGEKLREQLQTTFAGLERQLSILRSTQSYVEQQFASFNDNN